MGGAGGGGGGMGEAGGTMTHICFLLLLHSLLSNNFCSALERSGCKRANRFMKRS